MTTQRFGKEGKKLGPEQAIDLTVGTPDPMPAMAGLGDAKIDLHWNR